MDLESVAIKLSRSENLPALSNVVCSVMKLADDPTVSPTALEKVIEQDTGLTAKLLRVASSSYYGGVQVPSVGRAVSVLGIDTVKSLVLAISMQSLSSGESSVKGFDKVAFWQHSLAAALAARILGKLRLPVSAEELYSAAMLHDIGFIVMERFLPNELSAAMTLAQEAKIELHEAERQTLGFDHTEVGGLLAEKWGLSDHMYHAIRYHHSVMEDPMNYETTHIVSASNTLAHQCGFSTFPLPPEFVPEFDFMVLSTVDLPEEQLEIIRIVLNQEVRRAQDHLMISAA